MCFKMHQHQSWNKKLKHLKPETLLFFTAPLKPEHAGRTSSKTTAHPQSSQALNLPASPHIQHPRKAASHEHKAQGQHTVPWKFMRKINPFACKWARPGKLNPTLASWPQTQDARRTMPLPSQTRASTWPTHALHIAAPSPQGTVTPQLGGQAPGDERVELCAHTHMQLWGHRAAL